MGSQGRATARHGKARVHPHVPLPSTMGLRTFRPPRRRGQKGHRGMGLTSADVVKTDSHTQMTTRQWDMSHRTWQPEWSGPRVP